MDEVFSNFLATHKTESLAKIKGYQVNVDAIIGSLEGRESTPDQCAVSVQIPAYYKERNLSKTLLFYTQQNFKNKLPFEIIISINWPSAELIEGSEALRDARSVSQQYPHLNICVMKQVVPQKDFKIGQIRGCLALLSIMRAIKNPTVDLEKMIVVTNDADLWWLSPNYLEGVYDFFLSNPKIKAAGTFIDYPDEQISTNHLWILVQKCEEMLEALDKSRAHHLILRSGSSAYRSLALFEAWTFPKARKWESWQVVRNIKKKYGSSAVWLIPKYIAKLTTSARRHATAVYSKEAITNRYLHFGTPEDLALVYHDRQNGQKIRDTVAIVEDADFIEKLTRELAMVYKKRIEAKKREYTFGNEASTTEWEIDTDVLDELKWEVQKDFKKIAPFLGVKMDFPDVDTLTITNIDVARWNLRKKFSVFD